MIVLLRADFPCVVISAYLEIEQALLEAAHGADWVCVWWDEGSFKRQVGMAEEVRCW